MTKEEIIKTIKVLQSAMRANRPAVKKLFKYNVRCNKKLADHPTIPVDERDNMFRLSAIGIINGILDNAEWRIAACYHDDELMEFALYNVVSKETEYV